jgi:UDP-2-acetamido-3-amino-2,3-dideoxy-glucuronate N-acetyltransferase
MPLTHRIDPTCFIHESSYIDPPVIVGPGTRIWHFCHVMANVRIGRDCVLGQNVFVQSEVHIGDRVHIQNNVSVYEGVTLEDDVFCGPSAVFTNVVNPRSRFPRKGEYQATRVGRGATVGANATVVCGHVLGEHCFIAAGAVVTRDVPPFALVAGVPGVVAGWMSRYGRRLQFGPDGTARCEATGDVYRMREDNHVERIDSCPESRAHAPAGIERR